MFRKIKIFLEMIKFEHSLFALPFAYLGMILAANGWPGWGSFLWITAAMVSFRTMAMAANRLIDRSIDAANPRTASRALPAGLLTPTGVGVAAAISFLIFEWACLKLGRICFQLSWIPCLLAWVYPFLKRSTVLCHFLLGLILGIAPYGAWLGAGGGLAWAPGFLTLGVLFWVAGFDIIYALLDLDFDRGRGLYSVPAKLGLNVSKRLAQGCHAAAWVFWTAAGLLAGLNGLFFLGLAAAAFLMIREHSLVWQSADSARINEAFFHLNAWISGILFLSACLDVGGVLR